MPCKPRLIRAATLACFSLLPVLAQRQQLRPRSMYEPPAAAAAASLASSAQGVPPDLLTPGERSGWETTAPYDEVIALARRLKARSPYLKAVAFGTTPEGRTMYAIVASNDQAFTPEAARRTGKTVILIQSGIHSGEIEGKDTALMLLRDMTVGNKPHQRAWLEHAIFVVIPVFNVDGHEHRSPFNRAMQNGPSETGERNTAQNLNLNRDYLKADTPEMRALLALYNAWLPDFMFDNHVTDGADYQYDLTYDIAHNGDIGPASRDWVNKRFLPELNSRMQHDGHRISPYGELRVNPATGKREFFVEVFSPRYSHLYSAARNRPCLLVETHSLKSPRTRAWSNYDLMFHAIDIVTEQPGLLHRAVQDSDAADAAMAGQRDQQMFLAGKTSGGGHPLTYYSLKSEQVPSPITGKTVTRFTGEKEDLETVTHDGVDTTASAPVPTAFLIPAAYGYVADLLKLHGIQMTRTAADQTLTAPVKEGAGAPPFAASSQRVVSAQSAMSTNPEAAKNQPAFTLWRFTEVKKAAAPFEGHTFTDYKLQEVSETVTFPAGSYRVPLNQARARLIMALLHPAAPDALLRWGYFDQIFERVGRIGAGDYLSIPIAEKTAADNPELYDEFQAKLKAEPAFAADPQARLAWWLSRGNYQAAGANRYPVVAVW